MFVIKQNDKIFLFFLFVIAALCLVVKSRNTFSNYKYMQFQEIFKHKKRVTI